MQDTIMKNAKISHICSILPSKKVYNIDNAYFDKQSKEKIIRISNITKRYILDRNKDESLLALFKRCALHLLDVLKWDKDDIGGIIVISQSHEYRFPASSTLLQNELGLKNNCFAYDMIMGCSAYTYGLFSAMSHISSACRKILLFCGDSINDFVHPKNKSTAFLFSDAASCTALEYAQNSTNHFYFYTDGSRGDTIISLDGGSKNPISLGSFNEYIDVNANINNRACMLMKGLDVFRFSAIDVPEHVLNALAIFNLKMEDVNLFFFHQANKLVLDEIRRKLNIDDDRFIINIHKYANASCASIPLLMTEFPSIDAKRSMLIGFGVGLSICIAYIERLDCKTSLLFM